MSQLPFSNFSQEMSRKPLLEAMEEERRWEEMDTDCLVTIFGRLGLDDLLLSLPFVCKSWSAAAAYHLCWQKLDFRAVDFMPWSKSGKRFASLYSLSFFSFSSFFMCVARRSAGLAVELRLPLFFSASVDDLILASNECPRLRLLTLPPLMLEEEVHLPELVGRWKELEVLEMEFKPSTFPELAAAIRANCPKFRGLKMAGSIKKDDAEAIVRHLPAIKSLDLSRSYLPKEQLLVILKGCREMEQLRVNDCIGFQAEDKEIWKRARGVEFFDCRGSKLVDDFDYETDDCDPLHVWVI